MTHKNIIDKAVSWINPVAGARRQVAREILAIGGYRGASRSSSNMSGWNPVTQDADAALLPDLTVLVNRSRYLAQNHTISAGAINTKVVNSVGTGLRLQTRIDRKFLNLSDEAADNIERNIEREFKMWAESTDCDSSRSSTFHEIQSMVMRSMLVSGDVLVVLPQINRPDSPYRTSIQVIEADRLCNPDGKQNTTEISGGIEKDQYGAPVAYHIMTEHPGGVGTYFRKRTWQRIQAFGKLTGRKNVLHLYQKQRPGQTRGVPILAPVIDALKMLDRYTDAELMAAVTGAMYAVFITTEGDGIARSRDGQSRIDLGTGSVVELLPGEKVEIANPGRPNQAFDPFIQAILTQIGAALGLPFEVLRLHFSSSYSASRAALMEAWKVFNFDRKWMATQFCKPIYEIWLDEAVALGRISAPGYLTGDPAIKNAYLGSQWIGPSPGSLDPVKDANAARIGLEIGTTTLAIETEKKGYDQEEIHQQRVKEKNKRIEDGLELSLEDMKNDPTVV